MFSNEKFRFWCDVGRAFKKVYMLLKARGLWSKKSFGKIKKQFGCEYSYDKARKFMRFYFSYESLFEFDPDDIEFEPFEVDKPPSIIGLCEICDLNNIDKEKISM